MHFIMWPVFQQIQFGQLQCLVTASSFFQQGKKVDHQFGSARIIDTPERIHHTFGSGMDEPVRQTDHPFTRVVIANPRFTGTQHHQLGGQAHGV